MVGSIRVTSAYVPLSSGEAEVQATRDGQGFELRSSMSSVLTVFEPLAEWDRGIVWCELDQLISRSWNRHDLIPELFRQRGPETPDSFACDEPCHAAPQLFGF